jgi:hypothetical protein
MLSAGVVRGLERLPGRYTEICLHGFFGFMVSVLGHPYGAAATPTPRTAGWR